MEAYRRTVAVSINRGPAIGITAVVVSVALVVFAAEHGSFSRFGRTSEFVPAIPGVTVGDTDDRMPVVTSVRSNGSAERAGLEVGDEIVTVDGRRVRDVAALHDVVSADRSKRPLALHIRRGDALWTVAIDRAEPSADEMAKTGPNRTGTAHGAENPAD